MSILEENKKGQKLKLKNKLIQKWKQKKKRKRED